MARERDPWHVLLLAAVVLLAWNPYALLDAGFQLSFAAVIAIFLAAGPLLARARGLPDAAKSLARGGRGLDRVQRRDRADPLAPVRRGAAARGRRRTRSSSPRSARCSALAFATAVVEPVSPPLAAALGVAERLGRRLRRRSAPARSRRVPFAQVHGRGGRARSRRLPRGRGLCLAAMADELKPAYLIAGSDRPKVDRAVARLRARFDADAVELLDAAETTGDDAVAACNVMGLFGEGTRLVVVDGVEAWKAPDVKAIADYLKAPAPATTLALVGGELKKDAPLAKAVAAEGRGAALGRREEGGRRAGSPSSSSCTQTKAEPEACRAAGRARRRRPLRARGRGRQARDVGGRRRGDRSRRRGARRAARRVAAVDLTDAWGARDVGGVLRAAEQMLDRTRRPASRGRSRASSASSRSTSPRAAGCAPARGARAVAAGRGAAARDEAVPGAEALRAGAQLQRPTSSTTR